MNNILKIIRFIFIIIILCIISCTIGVSHKITINSYGEDTTYNKNNRHYNINIVNYPTDTVFKSDSIVEKKKKIK